MIDNLVLGLIGLALIVYLVHVLLHADRY
ncbi:potassium-transporting ATPase subunit F [Intrasporangium sp. DVR]